MFNISEDIFIYAKTKEEHDAIVTKVLQRMLQYITANKQNINLVCDWIFGQGFSYLKDFAT